MHACMHACMHASVPAVVNTWIHLHDSHTKAFNYIEIQAHQITKLCLTSCLSPHCMRCFAPESGLCEYDECNTQGWAFNRGNDRRWPYVACIWGLFGVCPNPPYGLPLTYTCYTIPNPVTPFTPFLSNPIRASVTGEITIISPFLYCCSRSQN